jgi:hypothetical protein
MSGNQSPAWRAALDSLHAKLGTWRAVRAVLGVPGALLPERTLMNWLSGVSTPTAATQRSIIDSDARQ